MFTEHYEGWRNSRVNGLLKYVSKDLFKNKSLLELGCGFGDLGNIFQNLGCMATSSDGREEHLEVVKKRYPLLKTKKIDCDKDLIEEHYDIILHWGLLYHLDYSSIKEHIKNCCESCEILLLETEVCDSSDPNFFISLEDKDGYDQSLNKNAVKPSQTYIETELKKNNFDYICIKDPILNSSFHIYDWEVSETKTWKDGLRRFWICWKQGTPSPLEKTL